MAIANKNAVYAAPILNQRKSQQQLQPTNTLAANNAQHAITVRHKTEMENVIDIMIE